MHIARMQVSPAIHSMSYHSYTQIEKLIGCRRLAEKITGQPVVVMGFQRSGTSLLTNLVHSCGVSLGKENEFRPPLISNPHGFFEHRKIFRLSWKYLRQAGIQDGMTQNISFTPTSFRRKIERLVTVRKMHVTLNRLSSSGDKWGMKLFPLFYYFWKVYLPKHKIVAIYRDPYASTHSYLEVFWPARFTYDDGLKQWLQAQKDMLYHITQANSLLIRYEDLVDDSKNDRILQSLADFIGGGDVSRLKSLIDPSLNRSIKKVSRLSNTYPEDNEISHILRILDNLRVGPA